MYKKNHGKYTKGKISNPKYKSHRQLKSEYEQSITQRFKEYITNYENYGEAVSEQTRYVQSRKSGEYFGAIQNAQ